MYDELEILSRVHSHLTTSYGYLDTNFHDYFPDISLKINDKKYAITIVTNITNSTDVTLAKQIIKQKQYYKSLGYEPLFFIERNQLGIDIDRQSLVLWGTELEALTIQKADNSWKHFLFKLTSINEFNQILNLPNTVTELNIKSIMYITPAGEEVAIEVFHVLELPKTSPVKAYFFSDPYKISFSNAFILFDNTLLLSDMEIEKNNQIKYEEKFRKAKSAFLERQKELERKRKIKKLYIKK